MCLHCKYRSNILVGAPPKQSEVHCGDVADRKGFELSTGIEGEQFRFCTENVDVRCSVMDGDAYRFSFTGNRLEDTRRGLAYVRVIHIGFGLRTATILTLNGVVYSSLY